MTKPLLENEIRSKTSQNPLVMTDETIPAIDDDTFQPFITVSTASLASSESPATTQAATHAPPVPPKQEISINELRANTRKYCRRFSEEVDQE